MSKHNAPMAAPVSAQQHVSLDDLAAALANNNRQLKGRDGAAYVRQQRGHSLLLNLFIVGPITMYITTVYYSVSKNHYWHL